MRARFTLFIMLGFLLFTAALITAQSGDDPSPACGVARISVGPKAEIQCREDAIKNAAASKPKIAVMLFWLADAYKGLDDVKADENYRKLEKEYCNDAPVLCDEAKRQLILKAKGPLEVSTQYTGDPYSFAISPDGRSIVLQGTVEGKRLLLLQQIDTGKKIAIPGSDSGRYPFWKPDGRSIGFFANSKLKRVDVEGTSVSNLIELADATNTPMSAAWSSAGVIVFAPSLSGPLYSVPERGGAPVAVTRVAGTEGDRFPQFAPDGRHFLYFHFPARTGLRTLMLGSLDSLETRQLTLTANAAQAAVFDSAGRLLYVDNGALFAQNLDSRMTPMGAPIQIIDRVAINPANPGVAALSVSSGRIAYREDTAVFRQFKWVDREGQPKGALGEPDKTITAACCLRLSPDDQTVAYQRLVGGGAGSVWTMNTVNGIRSSAQVGVGGSPAWSPAGDQLLFANISRPFVAPMPNLFQRSAVGGPVGGGWLHQSLDAEYPYDWHDNFLLYMRTTDATATQEDLFVLPLNGGGPVVSVANSPARELNGRFSPNGAWIVYQSDEAGDRFEIYVQALPGSASARKNVSRNGGTIPKWRRKDGREIYFLSPANYVMAAPVTPSADGQDIEIGAPVALFPAPAGADFDASSDGERFLLNAPVDDTAPPILILTNWVPVSSNAPGAPSARPPQPAPTTPVTVAPNAPTSNTAAVGNVQGDASLIQITIFDRNGNRLGTVGSQRPWEAIAISPDATQVAFSRDTNLFVVDTRTDTTAAITFTKLANTTFGFSPDSKHIAFVNAGAALHTKFSNGTGPQERRFSPATNFSNWSGDFLMLNSGNSQLALPLNGNTTPVSLVVAGGNTPLRLSPDNRFIAYLSSEDGSPQVWVRPFNPASTTQPSAATKITTDGVRGMIRWRADGQELYYLSRDGRVVAVPITTTPGIKVGPSTTLFRAPLGPGIEGDVSADGQRFVFLAITPAYTPGR